MTIEQELRQIPFQSLHREAVRIKEADLDWEDYLTNKSKEGNWLTENKIKAIGQDWLYPRIMTLLSTLKISTNENGLISGKKFWLDNVDFSDDWWRGLARFLMIDKMSLTIRLQNVDPGKAFCSLVPIVLAAHKKYNDIPYSKWDPQELVHLVPDGLREVMTWKPDLILEGGGYFETRYGLTQEALANLRIEALTGRVGKAQGVLKPVTTTYALSNTTNPIFAKMPKLVRILAAQAWCAHPNNRTKYMILDPVDWDCTPPILVQENIFIEQRALGPAKTVKVTGNALWD